MPLQIPTASLSMLGPWLTLAAFGAYHGLNPAMGWLFALSHGLQQNNGRAVWLALVPITLGHAASVAIAAGLLVAVQPFLPLQALQLITAGLLIAFGIYKLFNWYRHPRWVGMRVRWHELAGWSFLMATAHGAGLMVAPALVQLMSVQQSNPAEHATHSAHTAAATQAAGMSAGLAVGLHTASMLLTMAAIAWIVYRKLGLKVLKQGWINFDLIWSAALLVVGGIALVAAF